MAKCLNAVRCPKSKIKKTSMNKVKMSALSDYPSWWGVSEAVNQQRK